MAPTPRFLLDGARFSATRVSFAVYARMRLATAGDARLTFAVARA